MKMKTCKHCGMEIAKGAKVCPHCGGKNKKSKLLIILIIVLLLIVIGVFGSGGDDTGTSSEPIEYTSCDIGEMEAALEKNAASASDEYEDKYIEVTGILEVIDSDGAYITITDPDDEWDIIGITCYVTDESQLDVIKEHSTRDSVTVKGKITEVGEVLGYYMDIDEIK